MDISGENARGKTDGGWAFMYILCLSDVKEMNLNRVRKERHVLFSPTSTRAGEFSLRYLSGGSRARGRMRKALHTLSITCLNHSALKAGILFGSFNKDR